MWTVLTVLTAFISGPADASEKFLLFPLGEGYSEKSSDFGRRWSRFHGGMDFAARPGAIVHAAYPGRVTEVAYDPRCGHFVRLEHIHGFSTVYCHLLESPATSHRLAIGDIVAALAPIGLVGSTGRSTGPHLHFGVHRHGQPVNPAKFTFTPRETLDLFGWKWRSTSGAWRPAR